ncbi:hypothetical protein C8Q76DRAFT_786993 [Earliella scabrosa]|nr:hypothetical protein C8Q76DRAFT_786993 [Earliella scabrosa]
MGTLGIITNRRLNLDVINSARFRRIPPESDGKVLGTSVVADAEEGAEHAEEHGQDGAPSIIGNNESASPGLLFTRASTSIIPHPPQLEYSQTDAAVTARSPKLLPWRAEKGEPSDPLAGTIVDLNTVCGTLRVSLQVCCAAGTGPGDGDVEAAWLQGKHFEVSGVWSFKYHALTF